MPRRPRPDPTTARIGTSVASWDGSSFRPPRSRVAPRPGSVPRETLERLAQLLDYAYEAAWSLCDRGRADWSVLGEPITEALRIARAMRDEARDDARRIAA